MSASLLRDVLTAPRRSFADLSAFRADNPVSGQSPITDAIRAGARADRLGYAFSAGYAAALRCLVPTTSAPACISITEAGGGHPRNVQTSATRIGDHFRLVGKKKWATLAMEGEVLLVVASIGWEQQQNLLRLFVVPSGSAGLTLERMPETPFTPEIPHYSVEMDLELPASAMLPGDAFARYVKPFRTLEDTFVSAAALAYLLAEAQAQQWPVEWRNRFSALLLGFCQIAKEDPSDPATQLALGGALQLIGEWVDACDGCWTPGESADRWRRDRPLLQIAGRVREQRLANAWSHFQP